MTSITARAVRALRPTLPRVATRVPRMALAGAYVPRMPSVRAAYTTQAEAADFDPGKSTAMYHQEPPAPGDDFRVVMVSAGNINFGSEEGPWNHSFRLEHKLGPRLKVTALIDPNPERAGKVLKTKRESFVLSAYKDTIVYPSIQAYMSSLTPDKRPHAVWVGSPPAFRGREEPGRDLEKVLTEGLPGVPLFIEKPVSTGPVAEAEAVARMLQRSDNLVAVGYMLRYLKVVQKMKQILREQDLDVMAINARYIMAYEHTAKLDWWDKTQNCGPIVEQATHFCDLARYFGGEVDLSTVTAHSLEYFEKAGRLRKMPVDEAKVRPEDRIPRVTCATWKFESGAVGSLMHAVALQGYNYSTELEVYADGYSLRLIDPYNAPVLSVRRPGDDHEETLRYPNDDPFFTEVSNMIDCIERGRNAAPILSSFEDAVRTYALTWAIREASERSVRKP